MDADWTTVAANNLHTILLLCTLACLIAVDMKRGLRQPEVKEDSKAFLKTFLFGGTWFLILVAFASTPLDIITQILMTIYFFKGSAVEELLFRYALPRLLVFHKYGVWLSLIIANLLFSLSHYFVWNFNLATMLLGMIFGFANVIAFAFGRSFMGIVFSHMIYNLVLVGANWWYLILITIVVVILAFVREKI